MKHRLFTVTALIIMTWLTPLGETQHAAANQNHTINLNNSFTISPNSNQNNMGPQLSLMMGIFGSGIFGWLAFRNKQALFNKLFFQKTKLNQTNFSTEIPTLIKTTIKEDQEESNIELELTDITTYIKRAYSYFKQGDSKRAIEEFNRAVVINPQNAYLYGERANFRRKNLGDKQGAVEDYSKAICIHPQNPLFYLWRSQAYNDLGEQRKAIEDYNTAIRLAPENTMYHCFQSTANSRE